MSSLVCRLLPLAAADGPHNMAADEALLESTVTGRASLRFYQWEPPTVSLGYFQPAALRADDARLAALPFVRRPSGGLTLVHHHELTYALALPPGPPWQDSEPWLCRMHKIIALALQELGVSVTSACARPEAEATGPLCFRHHTAGDLAIGPDKVVGSAQRKLRGALLQHGGILLATSPHAPVLPGIAELSGRRLGPAPLADAVARAFERTTGWALAADDWASSERKRIEELVGEKYGRAEWNERR